MGKLHSQLALFGSIDDEVFERDDPQTTATVEQFLPGTTGYGQRGWYRELRGFIDRLSPTGSVHFPDRDEALRDLARPEDRRRSVISPADMPQFRDIVVSADWSPGMDDDLVRTITREDVEELFRRDEIPEPEAPQTANELPTSILARAIYAAAVITKIEHPGIAPPADTRLTNVTWSGIDIPVRRAIDLNDDPLTALLDLAAPQFPGRMLGIRPFGGPLLRGAISGNQRLQYGREQWNTAMAELQGVGLVEPGIAQRPPPCTGALRRINGQYCTVLCTEVFDERHDLEELMGIVDPQNWDQTLPSFFCAMQPRGTDPRSGWSRVLECVSTECGEYRLNTALKYWNGQRDETGIFINYDLDDDRRDDTGLVEVDSGYIWITRAERGVRIRTSKALRICGLSPTATAALACFSGWAEVGVDMLIDAADQPPRGAVDFVLSTHRSDSSPNTHRGGTGPKGTVVDIPRLPELPPGVRRDMVQDSAVQMNRFIDATSRIAQDFARRWQDGLTRTDLEQFGQSFGTEMTNYAVQALDSMMGNFRPKSKDEPTACAEPAVVSSVDKPGPIDRVGDVAREMVEQTKCAGEIAADRIDDDAYTASALIETASKLANIAIKGWIDLAGIALDQLAGEDSARTDDLTAASHRIADQATTISDAATLNAAAPVTIRGNGFGALMRTLTEIANLTFHRGVDLVETAIGQRPATGTTVLADHMTTIVRRMADHTRMVADDAAHKLDAEGYGPDDWAESMTKFGDVALVNGVELVGTALVGPSRYEVEPIRSDPFAVEHTDSRPRALSIATPLVLAGTDDAIAEHRITFEPPGGVLAPSEKVFRLRVRAAGLRSGVYTGSIRVGKLDESAPDNDVGEEIVPVVIGL